MKACVPACDSSVPACDDNRLLEIHDKGSLLNEDSYQGWGPVQRNQDRQEVRGNPTALLKGKRQELTTPEETMTRACDPGYRDCHSLLWLPKQALELDGLSNGNQFFRSSGDVGSRAKVLAGWFLLRNLPLLAFPCAFV